MRFRSAAKRARQRAAEQRPSGANRRSMKVVAGGRMPEIAATKQRRRPGNRAARLPTRGVGQAMVKRWSHSRRVAREFAIEPQLAWAATGWDAAPLEVP